MKLTNRLIPYLLAIFLGLAGCASTSKQEGTGEYVEDTVLTTKVKTAILAEPTLKSSEINVETYMGVVQLSGFVGSEESAKKALDVAQNVKGVKSVQNGMRLK